MTTAVDTADEGRRLEDASVSLYVHNNESHNNESKTSQARVARLTIESQASIKRTFFAHCGVPVRRTARTETENETKTATATEIQTEER